MKVALLSMQKISPEEAGADGFAPGGLLAWQKAELLQTVALALHMRDSGSFDPVIMCMAGSELERQAINLGLPHFSARNERDLSFLFRVWQWQRKQQTLLLLANGEISLPLAGKILFMRRRRHVLFVPAFFLRFPQFAGRQITMLRRSGTIICGSDLIRDDLAGRLAREKKMGEHHYIVHPPGLDLGLYSPDTAVYDDKCRNEGRHFVFGMAESLSPHSGALLVVRAMSAIWQTENLPPWEIRMFGSGPRMDEIMGEAASLGVLSRLSMLGDQFPASASAQCHVWLAAGTARVELPEVMGNAAASGLPLVCSSSRLHREWLNYMPVNVSLEIEKENPQELARAMLDLMRDSELRERLATASHELRAHVGVGEMAAKICAALEQLLL